MNQYCHPTQPLLLHHADWDAFLKRVVHFFFVSHEFDHHHYHYQGSQLHDGYHHHLHAHHHTVYPGHHFPLSLPSFFSCYFWATHYHDHYQIPIHFDRLFFSFFFFLLNFSLLSSSYCGFFSSFLPMLLLLRLHPLHLYLHLCLSTLVHQFLPQQ